MSTVPIIRFAPAYYWQGVQVRRHPNGGYEAAATVLLDPGYGASQDAMYGRAEYRARVIPPSVAVDIWTAIANLIASIKAYGGDAAASPLGGQIVQVRGLDEPELMPWDEWVLLTDRAESLWRGAAKAEPPDVGIERLVGDADRDGS